MSALVGLLLLGLASLPGGGVNLPPLRVCPDGTVRHSCPPAGTAGTREHGHVRFEVPRW